MGVDFNVEISKIDNNDRLKVKDLIQNLCILIQDYLKPMNIYFKYFQVIDITKRSIKKQLCAIPRWIIKKLSCCV